MPVWQVNWWWYYSSSGDCSFRSTVLPKQAWHSYADDVIFSWKKLSLVLNPSQPSTSENIHEEDDQNKQTNLCWLCFDLCLCGLVCSWFSRDNSPGTNPTLKEMLKPNEINVTLVSYPRDFSLGKPQHLNSFQSHFIDWTSSWATVFLYSCLLHL